MPDIYDLEEVGRLLEDASALVAELDATVERVVRVHENTRTTVVQLGRERSWMNSPVGRGGVRT